MARPPSRLAISRADLEALLERAKTEPLSDADYAILKAAVATLGYLTELLEDRTTTLQRLRQLLFGARTDKTRTVLPAAADDHDGAPAGPGGGDPASTASAPPRGALAAARHVRGTGGTARRPTRVPGASRSRTRPYVSADRRGVHPDGWRSRAVRARPRVRLLKALSQDAADLRRAFGGGAKA